MHRRRRFARPIGTWATGILTIAVIFPGGVVAAAELDPEKLARDVTIRRDGFGVPHIEGPTDVSVFFGSGYCQCEDYYWQLEDNFILALGRYSEFHGSIGLNSDLLNRAFEIVSSSRHDFPKTPAASREACEAFVAGVNYYLSKHPEEKRRLTEPYEPWQMLALQRQIVLELAYRFTRLSHDYAPRANKQIYAGVGSNAYAVGSAKTKSRRPILVINPHQPWFGFGQFTESHQKSGEGWEFTGGAFFGMPMPMLGHNHKLGWAATTNEPDIADAWREVFDDPSNPLRYRYGDGYRTAIEWKDTIRIKTPTSYEDRRLVFRKTHHGPIVGREDEKTYLSAMIGKLYESDLMAQARAMVRAGSLEEYRNALRGLNFPYMNLVYADRDGNIHYQYGGAIPRRDPRFEWSQPVDGTDPRTEWKGYHPLEELPHVLNPPSGYVQNCNSSPFTTTDEGNPFPGDFPAYMVEDKYDDKRRAKRARQLLRRLEDATTEDLQAILYDTTIYWAANELPRYARDWEALKASNSALAEAAGPYLEHLLDWDYRVTGDSTQATLCIAWYEELYGFGYPNETLKARFVEKPSLRFQALIDAAEKLKGFHGTWKVKWGDIHRIQRHANVADFIKIPFDDKLPSIPSWGAPSPPGVLFTQMYTPSIKIPLVKNQPKQYGVVGMTYVAVIEFTDRVKSETLLQFGQSGRPDSPHFFDQAPLLSTRKLKPGVFHAEDVAAQTRRTYHPGE